MRPFLLGLGLLALSTTVVFGCDVCGGAAGGSLMGIVPRFGNHFVGLRYQYAGFTTVYSPSILNEGVSETSREQFHTVELMGRFYPHPRIQLLGFVPYRANYQQKSGRRYEGAGLGDVSLLANYLLVNTGDSLDRKLKHTLLIGSGVKAPIGKNNLTADGERMHNNLQPGSGSWDVLFNAQYTLRYRKWGMSALSTYRLNTANTLGYRSGDRIQGMLSLFHWFSKYKWTVMPSAGLAIDHARRESDNGHSVRFSGGTELRGVADLQVYYGKVGAGLSCRLPLVFDLSDGTVTPSSQYMISLSILL